MSEALSASDEAFIEKAVALQPLVREHADQTERERQIGKTLVDAMTAAGLYRVAAPTAIGGGQTHPFAQIRVIEAISEADGATGWTLMIGIEVMGFLGAALAPEESVAAMCSVIANLGPEDSGKFLNYDGTELPW